MRPKLQRVDLGDEGEVAAQRAALEAFYRGMNGPAWTDQHGWLRAPDHCEWFGVVCCEAGGTVTSAYQPAEDAAPLRIGAAGSILLNGLAEAPPGGESLQGEQQRKAEGCGHRQAAPTPARRSQATIGRMQSRGGVQQHQSQQGQRRLIEQS